MSSRAWALIFLAVAAASQAGCCCGPIAQRTWGCDQCGDVWWNEWFSHPPACKDPCSCCGTYVGSRNPYVRQGPPPMGRPRQPYYNDTVMGEESYQESAPAMEPTPAVPRPAPELEPEPYAEPITATYTDEWGQSVSYQRSESPSRYRSAGMERPMEDRPMPQRPRQARRMPMDEAQYPSRPASRTLTSTRLRDVLSR